MRKLKFTLTIYLLCIACVVLGQASDVRGRITDTTGAPLQGITVAIRGTTTGTTTGADGTFRINAAPTATLVVSGVGMTTSEINVQNRTFIDVQLGRSAGSLSEVVVTALGIRRNRNQVPYAAQQIAGDEVSRERSSNFVQNLSGKISGLELRQANTLGGSTNVVIRGFKSLFGNNQALFVVDGVPFDNSNINTSNQRTGRGGYDYGNAGADFNPDDIESLTVLKGAAATALYGSRAGNGVILITTKRAVRGLGITVNSGFGLGTIDKTTFAKYQKEYGGGYGPFYEDPTKRFLYRDINGDGVKDLVVPTSEDASFGGKFDPSLQVYQWDAFDTTSPFYGKPRPWVGAANDPVSFFQKQLSSNQSIYLNGGSDRSTFKLGYTRTDDRGILPNSNQSKNMVDFGGTFNITPALVAGATVNYTNTAARGRYGTGYSDLNLATNFRQWWQTNVDVKDQKAAYFRGHNNVTWNWADPTDITPIYWDNPYFTRYENYSSDNRDRIFGNMNLTYKIADWLNILGRVSLDTWNQLTEERQAVGSVTVSNYTRANLSFRESNYDLLANFEKSLSKDFILRGLLGTNIRIQRSQSITASTQGGLVIPRFYALSNSRSPITAPVETDQLLEVDGVFAGATASWKNMLTIDATIRRDKSTTLPAGNNLYYYPSISGGFVFSQLMPSATWLSYGKVRANYAQVGNSAPAFSVFQTFTPVAPFGSETQYSVSSTRNNPALQPELTKSYEIGLEMSFLKNRLGFDASYYSAQSFNQILPVTVSASTGYTSKYVNAGTIRNNGVELSVNAIPVRSNNFSWNINVNWSRNRNKVLSLFTDPATGNKTENLLLATFQGGVSLNATAGQPYGTIRGSNYVLTNGEKTVGSDGRYLISGTSNEVIGNPNADWIGGINNRLTYKNLSLSWLIDVRRGGQVFSLDMYYGLDGGLYPETAGLNDLGKPSRDPVENGGGVIMKGVTTDGKANTIRVSNTEYGTFGYSNNPAAGFIYDAGFVKLREAVLTYSLPKSLISRINPFKGIDFSLIGRNLWIIHKNLPYADPEEIVSSGNLQGYQSGAYPTTRTFTFNMRLRF